MQQKFTKEFMFKNRGCYSTEQLEECSFMKKEEVLLKDILNSEISLKDKYWFVCKKLATKEQNQQIAIKCAEIVLHLYEENYPNNKAPREAIQAAKDYLKGKISINELRVKRKYAYAVSAVSAAADAAASFAASAAAFAFAAFAAFADIFANTDATDATLTKKLLTLLKKFCK